MTDAFGNALLSDLPRVLVEAPAGCGKTYEAVKFSCEMGKLLPPNQQVLLLTHTNAAKDEFAKRSGTTGGGSRVRISTLDAFLMETCAPYTTALGLPHPIALGLQNGALTFPDIANKTVELLERAPTIAEILGHRYPIIVLDEHQDASLAQHKSVCLIAGSSGARLRFFCDPMQAIYGFAGAAISIEQLKTEVDACLELCTPWRWRANPALGAWILDARQALIELRALPIGTAPSTVTVQCVGDIPDPGYSGHYDRGLVEVVQRFGDQEKATVLTSYNHQANAIDLQTAGLYTLNEGAEFAISRTFVRTVIAAGSSAKEIAKCVSDLVAKNSVGFTSAKREQVLTALGDSGVVVGQKKLIAPVLVALSLTYVEPSLLGACRALRKILDSRPAWIKRILAPRNLELLASLSTSADPEACLEGAIIHERQILKEQQRSIGTIHKAKGLEFDNVLIWNFSSVDFPATAERARLAYVAISRATATIKIVAPGGAVSPFLRQ